MPVSRIATATRGSPAEYFQAVSARTPEICEQRGSPAASLASRPCASSCEQPTYRVAPTEWGTPGASFAESGLKPNEPYVEVRGAPRRRGVGVIGLAMVEVRVVRRVDARALAWIGAGKRGEGGGGQGQCHHHCKERGAPSPGPDPHPIQKVDRADASCAGSPGRPGEPLRDQHFMRGRAIRGGDPAWPRLESRFVRPIAE